MAINPETQYPGKITASSANYPYGEARNITVPGDGTGTPWEAALVNDIFGMQQALLSEAGITPTGNPETAVASQYLNAIHTLNPRVFDTYDTDLAAYTALGDGQIVYCKGKASIGDGGGGFFKYDLASTSWVPLLGFTNSRGFKNKVVNGDFSFWDYATSQTTNGYGSDNRWFNGHSGSTKTHSQQAFALGQTDVPGDPEYYSSTAVTTGGGVSNYVLKTQRIEFVKTLNGQTATISFWAKADSSKDIAVEFYQDFGTSGSPSADVSAIGVTTFTLTNSWAKYYASVDIPSVLGKTLGTDLNDWLGVTFWFDAGSNYDARTNSLGNQSGTFDIAMVQIEPGPVETTFMSIPPEVKRDRVDRFIFKWVTDRKVATYGTIRSGTSARVHYPQPFISKLRASPNITASGQLSAIYQATGTATLAFSTDNVSSGVFTLTDGGGGVLNTGEGLTVYPSGANYLLFDAEL